MVKLLLKKHPGTPPDWVDSELLDRLEGEGMPWNKGLMRYLNEFAYHVSSPIHKPWKDFSWNDVDEMVQKGAGMIREDNYNPNKVVGLRPNVIGPGFAYHLGMDHADPEAVQDIDVDYSRSPFGRFINENLFFMVLRFPFKPEVIDDSGLHVCGDDRIILTDPDYATAKRLDTAKKHIKGLMEDGCENRGDVRSVVIFGSLWPTKEPKTDYIVDTKRKHGYAIYPFKDYNFLKGENSYQHKQP